MSLLFRNENGNVTTLAAITGIALLTAVFFSINTGSYFYLRNRTDRASDSISLSIATWEARGLNTISQFNGGMIKSIKLIRVILIIWAGSIGLALNGHPALFLRMTKKAPKVIRKLWAAGVKYSKLARRVKKRTPYIIISCYKKLLSYYKIKGVLYPLIPGDIHPDGNSLCLYVTDGEELTILGAVNSAREKAGSFRTKNIFKRKLLKYLKSIFFSSINNLLNLKGRIVPLVPVKDFENKQVVHFLGITESKNPFFKSVFKDTYSAYTHSSSAPYGGAPYKPEWKSRLIIPDKKLFMKLPGFPR